MHANEPQSLKQRKNIERSLLLPQSGSLVINIFPEPSVLLFKNSLIKMFHAYASRCRLDKISGFTFISFEPKG